MRVVALAALLSVAGCGGGVIGWVREGDGVHRESLDRLERDVARRAMLDMSCTLERSFVERVPDTWAYVVRGCGHAALYACGLATRSGWHACRLVAVERVDANVVSPRPALVATPFPPPGSGAETLVPVPSSLVELPPPGPARLELADPHVP